MYKKYALVSCYPTIEDIPFRTPFINRKKEKQIKKKILKKFPYEIDELNYLDNYGFNIKIPIVNNKEYYDDEEFIKNIIEKFNSLILKYNINILVLEEPLKKYRDFFNVLISKGEQLGILYMDVVINKVINYISKEEKDIKYVLIDGSSTDTEYILELIYENINSLTLITNNPKRYENYLQHIYEETGLVIQVYNKNFKQNIDGDIIINCSIENDKLFYCFNKDAYIIDFISDEIKLNNIFRKRKELKIINDFDLKINDIKITKDIALAIMLNSHRLLRSMFIYGYRSSMKEKVIQLKSLYNFKFYLKEVQNGVIKFLDNKNSLSYNDLNMEGK